MSTLSTPATGCDEHDAASDRKWRAHLASTAALATRLGRDPSQLSQDPEEKSRANWLSSQRMADKRGTLAPWRATELDAAWPEWRGVNDDDQWRANLKTLLAMVAGLGRDASKVSKDPGEKTSGAWLGTQRAADAKGTLAQWRVTELVAAWPEWRGVSDDEQWRIGLKSAVAAARLGHDPSKESKDLDEKTSGNWLSRQRNADRNGPPMRLWCDNSPAE